MITPGAAAAVARLVTRPAGGARGLAVGAVGSLASLTVYVGAAFWALAFGVLATLRHEAFLSSRFDLGNMTQAVWSTAHGHPLRVTSGDGAEIERLAAHVDPILAALVPVWLVWPSPVALIAVQAAALSLGALPVYWLARKHLASPRWGGAMAFVYLLYAPVQWNVIADFHPVALAIPLLLFAIWFLDEDRLVPFAAAAVLALTTKEEIGLVLAGLGLWYALRRGKRLVGGLIAAAGVAWTLIALQVIIPHFSHGQASPFLARYSAVGGTPAGFVRALVSDPGAIIAAMTTREDLVYLVWMLLPLLGLWALEPLMAVAALPELALNLLSSSDAQLSVGAQYVSGIVPFLIAASVLGLGRLRVRNPEAMRLATVSLLAATAIYSVALGPVWFARNATTELTSSRAEAAKRAVALVPPGDAVSATNRLGAHLSTRRYVYSFPVLKNARWVVVDKHDPWLATYGERDRPVLFARFLTSLRADLRFERVFTRDGFSVFERRDRRKTAG